MCILNKGGKRMKNKKIVMTAIAKEMEFQFKIATHPNNDEDFKQKAKDNIKDLYDAYFELRGHRGNQWMQI